MPIGSTTGFPPPPFAKAAPEGARTGEGGATADGPVVSGRTLPLPETAARLVPGKMLSPNNIAQLVNMHAAAVLPGAQTASTPHQVLEQTIKRLSAQIPEGADPASGKAPAAQAEETLRATTGANRAAGGDGASAGPDGGKPAPDQPAPNPASLLFGQLPSRRENLESTAGIASELAKKVVHPSAAEKEPLRLTAYPLAVSVGNWPIKAGSIVLALVAFLGFLYFH